MIVMAKDRHTTLRTEVKGGQGTLFCLDSIGKNGGISEADTLARVGTLTEMTFPVGYSIGEHAHTENAELFYVLDGELVIIDNGTEYVCRKGDLNYCCNGSTHALENRSSASATVLCMIIN